MPQRKIRWISLSQYKINTNCGASYHEKSRNHLQTASKTALPRFSMWRIILLAAFSFCYRFPQSTLKILLELMHERHSFVSRSHGLVGLDKGKENVAVSQAVRSHRISFIVNVASTIGEVQLDLPCDLLYYPNTWWDASFTELIVIIAKKRGFCAFLVFVLKLMGSIHFAY